MLIISYNIMELKHAQTVSAGIWLTCLPHVFSFFRRCCLWSWILWSQFSQNSFIQNVVWKEPKRLYFYSLFYTLYLQVCVAALLSLPAGTLPGQGTDSNLPTRPNYWPNSDFLTMGYCAMAWALGGPKDDNRHIWPAHILCSLCTELQCQVMRIK